MGFDHDDEDGWGVGCRESQKLRETLNPSLTEMITELCGDSAKSCLASCTGDPT